jgi:hypothetical protein
MGVHYRGNRIEAFVNNFQPQYFYWQEVIDGVVTFQPMERNGRFSIKYQRPKKFLWWNSTETNWVYKGFIPMDWSTKNEAFAWIEDLEQRALSASQPWKAVGIDVV